MNVTLDSEGKWARLYFRQLDEARRSIARHEKIKAYMLERVDSLGSPRMTGMPRKPADSFDHSMDNVIAMVDYESDDRVQWAIEELASFEVAINRLRGQLQGKLGTSADVCWLRLICGLSSKQVGASLGYTAQYVRELSGVFADYLDFIGPARFFCDENKED